jgi:D-inositol-3-phosphate glycosyltransferase
MSFMKKYPYKVVVIEPLGKGGWAQYTYCLLSHLSSRIEELVLVTDSNTRFLGMKLPYVVKPILFSMANRLISLLHLQNRRSIRRILRAIEIPFNHLKIFLYCLKTNPDIIHFQTAYSFEGLIIPLYRYFGIKVVYTAHDLLHYPPYPGDMLIFSYMYRRLNAIIVNGRSLKNDLLALFPGVRPANIFINNLGNDLEMEDLPNISRREARSRLSISRGEKVILFYGIIRPYKGLEVLIRAFAILLKKLPEARLFIAGEPIGGFTEYQNIINRLEIGEWVKVFPYFIPLEETPTFFTAADVVAIPYLKSYQTGIAPIAYSYSRPVVVSRVGGLVECIEEGKSGYSFQSGDAGDLAERLFLILSDVEKNTGMKEFAGQYYRDNFSWRKITLATLAVYREALEGTSDAGPGLE